MKVTRVLQVIQYHRKLDHAFRRGFPMTPEGVALYCEDVKRRWRARGMVRGAVKARKEHVELVAAADRMPGIAPITAMGAMLLAQANMRPDRQAMEQMRQHRDVRERLDGFLNLYGHKR